MVGVLPDRCSCRDEFTSVMVWIRCCTVAVGKHRGVAQLAEQRSPKPQVAGSSPVAPAKAY